MSDPFKLDSPEFKERYLALWGAIHEHGLIALGAFPGSPHFNASMSKVDKAVIQLCVPIAKALVEQAAQKVREERQAKL